MTRNVPFSLTTAVVLLVLIVSFVVSVPGVAGFASDNTGFSVEEMPVEQQSGANVTGQNTSNTSSVNASVVFRNQTTNGSTITVKRAILPHGGFVTIHTTAYTDGLVSADESVIAVSQYLPAGSYQNLTIDISHSPPANPPGLNRTQLNESGNLTVALFRDTNGNQRYDVVRSFGENDSLVTQNGSVVRDSARVRVPMPEPTTASVVFQNQTLQNNTLIVEKARLPRGGFLVAYNASLRGGGDPLTSAVGLSRYLPPGNYSSVPVRVLPGALDETQVVTVRPALDTNDNQQYDYIRSDGFRDLSYETLNHSAIVQDTALVRVPAVQQATATVTPTPTSTPTPAATTTQTTTSRPPSTAASRGGTSGSSGVFGGFGIWSILVIVAVAIGLILVAQRLR